MSNWKTPKVVLAGRKLTVGEVLVPSKVGIVAHPQYGELPTLTVTEVKVDGSLLAGTAKCQDCNEIITIHAGDWFQKRRCAAHQRKAQRRAANPPLSAEVKALREAEKAVARAEKEAKENAAREVKAAARAAAKIAKAEAKAADLKAKAEAKAAKLIATQVAAAK
jgi:hypothetical protein